MAKGMQELLNEARAQIREVSPELAAHEIEAGPETLILDVREPTEFREGHIPGALLIPRGLLEPRAAADSPALADAYLRKLGGDSMDDVSAALRAYEERIGWER